MRNERTGKGDGIVGTSVWGREKMGLSDGRCGLVRRGQRCKGWNRLYQKRG